MDLRTHYPYSLLRWGIINSYPSLRKNIRTDVAVLGAGISGALVAYHLQEKGIPGVVLDKRHVGMGSTAASTSFIQYEIDTSLSELAEKKGFRDALRAYEISRQAVKGLEKLSKKLKGEFVPRCSLQLASVPAHMKKLEKEWSLRINAGFDVQLLDKIDLQKHYRVQGNGALLSDCAGEMDAYQFTHILLSQLDSHTFPVYDHTDILHIEHGKKQVKLITGTGHTITARKLVIACGYESGKYLRKKMEDLRCTFAFASEPTGRKELWKDNCLIWETANPYHYIRTSAEGRVMMGGQDIPYVPVNRQLDLLPAKTALLLKKFGRLFPHISIQADFRWAGAFATSPDGLPYIGSVRDQPDTYFALGYGGNGITFSFIAAEIISSLMSGGKPAELDLFAFDRD